jgi:hypothetical protein
MIYIYINSNSTGGSPIVKHTTIESSWRRKEYPCLFPGHILFPPTKNYIVATGMVMSSKVETSDCSFYSGELQVDGLDVLKEIFLAGVSFI